MVSRQETVGRGDGGCDRSMCSSQSLKYLLPGPVCIYVCMMIKKPDTKDCIVYNPIYMQLSKSQDFSDREKIAG